MAEPNAKELFEGKFLLYDSSITNLDKFFDSIYKYSSYRDVRIEEIDAAKETLLTFAGTVNLLKCRAINEVVEELCDIQRITSDKLKNLNLSEKFLSKRCGKTTSHPGKEALNDFALTVTNVLKVVKNSRYSPAKSEFYSSLEELTIAISDATAKKKPEEIRPHIIKKHDKKTDAKLVATAYYLSLAKGQPVAILCNDRDITNILSDTYRFISLPFISHMKYAFVKGMEKNPVSIYSCYSDGLVFRESTDRIIPFLPYTFPRISQRKKDEFRRMAAKTLSFLKPEEDAFEITGYIVGTNESF